MMTFGIKVKQYIVTLFILLSIGLSHSYAQSDEVLAKSYFLKAQEAYSEGNNITALAQLDKTLEYLGTTNPKVEALYVKIAMNKKDYENAEKHLNTYFKVVDEGHSDYVQMLGYVAEVKEKIAEKKAEETEYKSKREQKIQNEVVEYFEKNRQICCNDYLEREKLNIDWNTAKIALESVVIKDMYGSSIKNDTLFQSATHSQMPLSEFINMAFEVSEAKPNTFSITSSKLTVKSIYGTKIDIYLEGRLNPIFVKNVNETLLKVVQQKRVIKYLREHPDKFPEKSQLLNLQSYLFAYGDRKEYDEDFPEGKKEKEKAESKNESNATNSIPEKGTSLDRWGRSINTLTKAKEENWSTLSQKGYAIDYPNNWSIDNNVNANSGFVLASPENSENKTAFIRMESGNLDNNISLNSYAEIYVNGYLKKNYNGVNIIQNETRERNGYSYKYIECRVVGKDNLEFDFLSNIIIHNRKVYVILFFRKSNELESLLPTAKKMLNSFSFL